MEIVLLEPRCEAPNQSRITPSPQSFLASRLSSLLSSPILFSLTLHRLNSPPHPQDCPHRQPRYAPPLIMRSRSAQPARAANQLFATNGNPFHHLSLRSPSGHKIIQNLEGVGRRYGGSLGIKVGFLKSLLPGIQIPPLSGGSNSGRLRKSIPDFK
ncbi:hypothetical protein ACFX13_016475 [Malus domestica]